MKFRWLSAVVCTATLGLAAFQSPDLCYAQGKTAPKAAAEAVVDDTNGAVVIVALNSIDSLLPNIQHVARMVGAGAATGGMTTIINQFAGGLDKTRPIGVFVNMDENNQPSPVGCLPIEDLEAFFEQLSSVVGEPEDLGDGLYQINVGPGVYAKKVGTWLYVGQTEDALSELSENMGDVLPKMIKNYDVRIQVNPQNIPEDVIEFLTSQIQLGMDQAANSGNMDPDDAESAREASEQAIAQIEEAIDGTEKLVIGLAVNKQEKKTILDFGSQFVADSKFAKQIEKMKGSKTTVAGTVQDSSMMGLQTFQLVGAEEIAQFEKSLDSGLKAALKDADESIKKLAEKAVDILVESAKLGKLESGVDVSVQSGLSILTSITVADGAKIESLASELAAELAKEKAPVQLKINTGKHAGFNLHSATVEYDLPPEAAEVVKKIFGDKVTIAIATGPKSVHIAVGKTCDASIKSAIDRSAAKPSAPAEMVKMRLVLSQLLGYIQSIESNPISEAMLGAATKENDRIMIDSQIVERGAVVRLSIEDGVMKAIAAGAKAGRAGGGF